MKKAIHPKWYPEAVVKCVCGNTFKMGASVLQIDVDVCAQCHPFYTGQMKYVDTAGRVDSFRAKQSGAQAVVLSKKDRREIKKQQRINEELQRPETLEELRKALKIGSKKN